MSKTAKTDPRNTPPLNVTPLTLAQVESVARRVMYANTVWITGAERDALCNLARIVLGSQRQNIEQLERKLRRTRDNRIKVRRPKHPLQKAKR